MQPVQEKYFVCNSTLAALQSGRITPSEMLQHYGLERSLSATHNDRASFLTQGIVAPVGTPQSLGDVGYLKTVESTTSTEAR